MGPLQGFCVGITADRRAAELGELFTRRGAQVVHGPAIGTSYLGDEEALRSATVALINRPPDILVANTGIGMRSWFEAAQAWDLADELVAALGRAVVVARGPKAAGAAQRAGLVVQQHVESERLSEVRDVLLAGGVAGRRIAVQLHGEDHAALLDDLAAADAVVQPVPVYRWHMPADTAPALRLIEAACAGRIDALTFTSAPALRNLVGIAAEAGLEEALLGACNGSVLVACVGPVCADAARALGVARPVAPAVGRMGHLVRVVVEGLQERRRVLCLAGHDVVVQGSTVSVDGEHVTLSPRERHIFDVLTEAPGAMISKAQLERRVWGEVSRDGHRLHVNIGRLRQRLGHAGEGIEPVYGRGYRLKVTA